MESVVVEMSGSYDWPEPSGTPQYSPELPGSGSHNTLPHL